MTGLLIKPNSGAAVLDTVAAGSAFEPQTEWLKRQGVDFSHRIALKKLSHVRYQHPDLDEITKFLAGMCLRHILNNGWLTQCVWIDFGMGIVMKRDDEIWFKGYGPDQYVYYACKGPKRFLGGAFAVETEEELQRWDIRLSANWAIV